MADQRSASPRGSMTEAARKCNTCYELTSNFDEKKRRCRDCVNKRRCMYCDTVKDLSKFYRGNNTTKCVQCRRGVDDYNGKLGFDRLPQEKQELIVDMIARKKAGERISYKKIAEMANVVPSSFTYWRKTNPRIVALLKSD